jgi:hypothetical protein
MAVPGHRNGLVTGGFQSVFSLARRFGFLEFFYPCLPVSIRGEFN